LTEAMGNTRLRRLAERELHKNVAIPTLRTTGPRVTSTDAYAPPDSYAPGIAALRAADAVAESSHRPCTKTELQYDANGMVDSYAADLAKMRKEAQ
jgi:hypothetical protein